MKVYCLGYYEKGTDTWQDCNLETIIRSYEQLHNNPNWMEFSPAQRLADDTLAIFSQCMVCAEMEEDSNP